MNEIEKANLLNTDCKCTNCADFENCKFRIEEAHTECCNEWRSKIEKTIEALTEIKQMLGFVLTRENFEGLGESDRAEFESDMDIALEALKEKAERDKGCEYCNTVEHVNGHYRNFYKAFPHHNDDKIFTSLDFADLSIAHDNESGWVLHFEDENGDRMFDIKINHCPHCGRKLGESNE